MRFVKSSMACLLVLGIIAIEACSKDSDLFGDTFRVTENKKIVKPIITKEEESQEVSEDDDASEKEDSEVEEVQDSEEVLEEDETAEDQESGEAQEEENDVEDSEETTENEAEVEDQASGEEQESVTEEVEDPEEGQESDHVIEEVSQNSEEEEEEEEEEERKKKEEQQRQQQQAEQEAAAQEEQQRQQEEAEQEAAAQEEQQRQREQAEQEAAAQEEQQRQQEEAEQEAAAQEEQQRQREQAEQEAAVQEEQQRQQEEAEQEAAAQEQQRQQEQAELEEEQRKQEEERLRQQREEEEQRQRQQQQEEEDEQRRQQEQEEEEEDRIRQEQEEEEQRQQQERQEEQQRQQDKQRLLQLLEQISIFPSSHPLHKNITNTPVDINSESILENIGNDVTLFADFGSGTFKGEPKGIPYVVVGRDQPKVPITFRSNDKGGNYEHESDKGPFPIPLDAPVEADFARDGHVISIDVENGMLYELYNSEQLGDGWAVSSAAAFNLNGTELRPDGWTSADAAGLPIFPLLIRNSEIETGEIDHAIRFSLSRSKIYEGYVSPARHLIRTEQASNLLPFGGRLRLKADFDISSFSPTNQVILRAMKKYGLILADVGRDMFLKGDPNEKWDNLDLRELRDIKVSDFEVIELGQISTR